MGFTASRKKPDLIQWKQRAELGRLKVLLIHPNFPLHVLVSFYSLFMCFWGKADPTFSFYLFIKSEKVDREWPQANWIEIFIFFNKKKLLPLHVKFTSRIAYFKMHLTVYMFSKYKIIVTITEPLYNSLNVVTCII